VNPLALLPVLAAAKVPIDLSRDPAEKLALAELSHPDYQAARPSALASLYQWLNERLNNVLASLSAQHASSLWAGLALFALAILGALAVRSRVGPLARTGASPSRIFNGPKDTAADYRQRSQLAAEAEDWEPAVMDATRAVFRSLEEAGLVSSQPGWTAAEAAAAAGLVLPALAVSLSAAASQFDAILYGLAAADAAGYSRIRGLDQQVSRTRRGAQAGAAIGTSNELGLSRW
jgi:hypothetical protein